MYFYDRSDAGQKLADALKKYKSNPNTYVVGLARGGVVVAAEVAKKLELPLDVSCPRKIGAPDNPELAIGAIDATGATILDQHLIDLLGVDPAYIEEVKAAEQKKAIARTAMFRKGKAPQIKGATVILVDDGIATGATMKVAINSMKQLGAKKVVVAIPVSSIEALAKVKLLADETICLSSPPLFAAVGQFYQDFRQTEDDEVMSILQNHPI